MQSDRLQRRDLLVLLGGGAVAIWPAAARAQRPAMPIVGFLSGLSATDRPHLVESFRRGLGEAGYVAGQNVAIEYRYAGNQPERLRTLAADLIARRVNVIVATGGNNVVLAAKALTSTIPIVFTTGTDPVLADFAKSLNRPEGNVTGVSWFAAEVGPKHLDLARELIPHASRVLFMINPKNQEASLYEEPIRKAAAVVAGLQVESVKASTPGEIDAAFERAVQQKADVVIVAGDPFFSARAAQLVVLAAHNHLPTMFFTRELTMAGGLISYGNDIADAYRRAGIHAAKILKGAKPSELPIDRATRFELVINLQTAKTLKVEIPAKLLALADAVVE
jgi:putative ABC transport system substrate-binding protein